MGEVIAGAPPHTLRDGPPALRGLDGGGAPRFGGAHLLALSDATRAVLGGGAVVHRVVIRRVRDSKRSLRCGEALGLIDGRYA